MLIDLDDTIVSAYSNPRAVWIEVATELSGALGTLAPEEAASAIDAINTAYDRNSQAAREIAEAYFDATDVASRIVTTALRPGSAETSARTGEMSPR